GRNFCVLLRQIDSDGVKAKFSGGDKRAAATHEWIENYPTRWRDQGDQPFHEGKGFDRGMIRVHVIRQAAPSLCPTRLRHIQESGGALPTMSRLFVPLP